jgi:AcrR family transcriptional regulator
MGREKKLSSAGRESFVDAVLDMLDEGTGIRDLNLRAVAKRVGCAHTNAYNYFASFEELLWWSLRGALERMIEFTDPETEDLVAGYIAFALEHPAWYRLIWLDPLGGEPPASVKEYLPVPAGVFERWVEEHLGGARGIDVERATRILHGYLHGELAAIVSGRLAGSRDELTERVQSGADVLIGALFAQKRALRSEIE